MNNHNLCFLAQIRKINVYPCKHQFYNIKVGFKGTKLYKYVFMKKHFAHQLFIVCCSQGSFLIDYFCAMCKNNCLDSALALIFGNKSNNNTE